jgi:hypothetical protein
VASHTHAQRAGLALVSGTRKKKNSYYKNKCAREPLKRSSSCCEGETRLQHETADTPPKKKKQQKALHDTWTL